MVAVMEQRHIPAGSETFQELQQRTGSLRELEPEHTLVLSLGTTSNHVTGMALGHLILTDVPSLHVLFFQCLHDQRHLLLTVLAEEGHVDLSPPVGCVAIRELGDHQGVDVLVESEEGTRCFGDNHGEQGLLLFSQESTLGYKTQTLEVHVGARGDSDAGLSGKLVLAQVFFAGSDGESSGRLDNRAGILKDVFDRSTDLERG